MSEDVLNEVLVHTFETVAFWQIEKEAVCEIKELPQDSLVYSIDCETPRKYNFSFCISKETANNLSLDINQDLLEGDDEQIDDCIKEILNIYAGEFCTKVFNEEESFLLSIPKRLNMKDLSGKLLNYKADEGEFWVAVH